MTVSFGICRDAGRTGRHLAARKPERFPASARHQKIAVPIESQSGECRGPARMVVVAFPSRISAALIADAAGADQAASDEDIIWCWLAGAFGAGLQPEIRVTRLSTR